MLLFTIIAGIAFSSDAERQYHEMMEIMVEKQSRSIREYVESYELKFNKVAQHPFVEAYIAFLESPTLVAGDNGENGAEEPADDERGKALRALNAITHDGSGITGVTIFNAQNEIVLSAGSDMQAFILSAARQDLDEGELASIPVGHEEDRRFELILYAPAGNSHYIMCMYSDEDIRMFFNRSNEGGGKVVLICPLGNVLDINYRGNMTEGRFFGNEFQLIKGYLDTHERYNTGTMFSFTLSAIEYQTIFNKIEGTRWRLGFVARTSDMFLHANNSAGTLTGFMIAIAVFAVACNIVFVLRFTKPLIVIRDTLVKIRRGDHEARINISSGNEYGEIAKEFNDLLDNVVVSEGRYRTVVEMSDNIIFEWNFQTDEVSFSTNFSKKFSYRAPSDSFNDSFLKKGKIHPEDGDVYSKTLDKLAKGEKILHDEFRWKNIYGDYVWVLMRATSIRSAEDEILKVVGVIVDIDRAKKSEKILSAKANYDALTSLYNRETVENLINNEIELIAARKNEFSILFIDVDDFKFFNDNYSHATGDQVLQFTAKTLNDIVSKYGMAGRFGGDEFIICIRNSEINDPANTAKEILDRLKEGFVCDVGDRLSVNVSIGIAVIRDTTKRVDEIIEMADEAMYKIKKSGKSNFGFITD
jgi:diguanylate cyclase (GGDEF)-like protein/PAS domain S-box-containing protein